MQLIVWNGRLVDLDDFFQCRICEHYCPLDQFPERKNDRRYYCRACWNDYQKWRYERIKLGSRAGIDWDAGIPTYRVRRKAGLIVGCPEPTGIPPHLLRRA